MFDFIRYSFITHNSPDPHRLHLTFQLDSPLNRHATHIHKYTIFVFHAPLSWIKLHTLIHSYFSRVVVISGEIQVPFFFCCCSQLLIFNIFFTCYLTCAWVWQVYEYVTLATLHSKSVEPVYNDNNLPLYVRCRRLCGNLGGLVNNASENRCV